jgi:hypothetical protein
LNPDSPPIGVEELAHHEPAMLCAAAIALAVGSVMSLATILVA